MKVVKCLIEEGGADIEATITPGEFDTDNTVLSQALIYKNYALAQWLIEKGALIPADIWWILSVFFVSEHVNAAELSSLLKVLTLLPMSLDQDRALPAFADQLSPQHAEICTRGRQLRAQLPAYMEHQEASVGAHCPLPAVLEAMVTAYALPTHGDLWNNWAEWM
jgi:hypothetical protein